MDKVASLMNDTAKTVYTYTAVLPYLQMALDKLQENFEINNIPVTSDTSAAITVNAGTTSINPVDGVGAGAAPNYPTDLVEIRGLYERLSGTSDPYILVTKLEYLPHDLDVIPTGSLIYWAWEKQRIVFPAATANRQVKLDYIAKIFPNLIDQDTTIGIINAKTYLQYKTAALCSRFIGANPSRANDLDVEARDSLDLSLGISVKGKQSHPVRKRPFRNSYTRRSSI